MSNVKQLIIIGAATPTIIRVIDDINQSDGEKFCIIGFLDRRHSEIGGVFYDLPVLGGFDFINKFDKKEVVLVNTIAGSADSRRKTTEYFLALGYQFVNVIHPSVNLRGVTVGEGNLIYENAMIHPFVSIGNYNVISSNSGIAHETTLADYVFVGPASYICGKCTIGEQAYIGVGAKILPRIVLGEKSIIGAGAIVTRNVPDSEKYIGMPARKT
jgi:sugar O-acyltransferase (sialic acid O-acetyltransferase NeuD family)